MKHAAVKYAELVKEFSNLPDGRGANHALLARFFGKLLQHWSTSPELPRQAERFALSYIFEDDSKAAQNEARWTLNKAVKYESCLDFVTKTNSETSKSLSRLLFLRGFPSAEWLGVIDARYRIDSEFFMRFLHFKPARDTTPNYSLPALPAETWNILELPIVTIGERKVLPGLVDQSTINTMRKEAGLQLQVHHDLLRGNDGVVVASSVVRDISIIDHSCFALEQCIWICLQPLLRKDSDGGRWTLVVWTDAGRTTSVKSILDLNVLPKEFQTEATSLLPVIDHKPGTGLAAQRYTSLGHVYPIKGAEAASQLCDGYGRTLHEDVMASDPLYALTEVFNVTTASLQAQCQDAISNLMNNINLKEVRNSYEQSKRIGKLTFLAFLFAPLSFTTSFFAMNIGLQNLTLKTRLAMTIGLLSITFFLMVVNFSGWIKLLQNKMHHATKKARYL
ncbi:Mg2+ transporter protein, CorA-like/Zinc transport protein ZntB [Metarhizium brunneum]